MTAAENTLNMKRTGRRGSGKGFNGRSGIRKSRFRLEVGGIVEYFEISELMRYQRGASIAK